MDMMNSCFASFLQVSNSQLCTLHILVFIGMIMTPSPLKTLWDQVLYKPSLSFCEL
uniref:Uncharacterized protein n=1 Tax=Arundo donax TaxID=35708 RepID=A0A0A9A9A7_ARUDO